MALDRRTRERMLALCGEIHEDDGVDPRTFFGSGRSRKKNDRKARQLCHQVAEALGHVLAGETGDDGLRDLHVVSVVPAPDSSRLLVTVHAGSAIGTSAREALARRLAKRRGRLRCEVAAPVTRRKTPALVFHVIGPDSIVSSDEKEDER